MSFDFVVIAAGFAAVCTVPVFFLVPFNDEWLRMNYLADHSLWEWIVMHAETWVMRPTSELIMGLAALPTTRPALAHDFTPRTFLARFHAVNLALVLAFALSLYAVAAAVAGSRRALPHMTLLLFGVLVSWLMATEVEYAFYWVDGYGNLLLPFAFCCCGIALLLRQQLRAALGGAALFLVAALGHEIFSIYLSGVVLLVLAFRWPEVQRVPLRVVWAALLLLCLGIVVWQLFGEGPTQRHAQFERASGTRYDLAGAWRNLQVIDPLHAAISVLSSLLAIGVYRGRLGELPARAEADARKYRWFWILLVAGTFVTCFLPLASVGLKKARLAVAYYSVATHLLCGLLGVLAYPLCARALDRLLAGYRRTVGSLVPIVVLVAAFSNNIADYKAAVDKLPELRAEAFGYMQILFDAPKDARLRMCRPRHRYSKPGRTLTDDNQEQYFGIAYVYNRCYGERR